MPATRDQVPMSPARAAVLALAGVLLSACQTAAHRECEREGHAPDSEAFSDCVAERRLEGGVEMKRKAGGNLGRRR